ncbi:hypothetical protein NDK47_11090 [Brevibacillus ruminantium]|uniref:Uncharacterized protein n=1 Tax=Brevibacillus ruminantium TaxID=2950604 RepID=A0ABY4WLN9_9BACL|nr:hypothetical protein [Brevibacillus ruminantium]USG67779.1 hypothetical protein NDK47_11090 [Brevibacillus ruminantium]
MGISNLIPNEYLPDSSIDQQLTKEQGGTHLDKIVKIMTASGGLQWRPQQLFKTNPDATFMRMKEDHM